MAQGERRKQSQRREEAVAKLLDAAIELIAAKGYDGFTLAEVGAAAGFSRGLPAHYFGAKEGLLEAMVAKITRDALAGTANTGRQGLDAIEYRVTHFSPDRARTTGGRALFALLLGALFEPALHQMMRGYNAAVQDHIASDFRTAIALGQIRPDADVVAEAQAVVAFRRGSALMTLTDPTYDAGAREEAFLRQIRARLAR